MEFLVTLDNLVGTSYSEETGLHLVFEVKLQGQSALEIWEQLEARECPQVTLRQVLEEHFIPFVAIDDVTETYNDP